MQFPHVFIDIDILNARLITPVALEDLLPPIHLVPPASGGVVLADPFIRCPFSDCEICHAHI